MRYEYTEEDVEFLKQNYPIGNWDKIHNRFKDLSDSAIHHKCNRLGIVFNNKYKVKNTSKNKPLWTDEEIEILTNNYSNLCLSDIQKLLPNRTIDSIKQKASNLNIISFYDMNNSWKDEEIEYLKNNWVLVPDALIAKDIGKTFRAVKWKRAQLRLYRQDMDSNSYPTLAKFLRGNNQALTGSKNFEIHHLYGVSNIINDIFKKNEEYSMKKFDEYNQDDLDFLLNEFLLEQAKYPLGVCIDKKIHVLFHSMYGQYYNTVEQWKQFKIDYMKGRYKNIVK